MDSSKAESFVNAMWDDSIIPELCEYIKVPNKSPMFDPDWEKHGYMDEAVQIILEEDQQGQGRYYAMTAFLTPLSESKYTPGSS